MIDYAKTSLAILGLVVQHVGPVYVAADVLEEVEQLDVAQCQAIGLTVVDGNLAQLTEASPRGGPLSFEDKLCLVMARDNGWACLSNDWPLREACKAQGVTVVWGLEIMLALVEGQHLSAADAIQVAHAIHSVNPMFITAKVLAAFQRKVAEKIPKSHRHHAWKSFVVPSPLAHQISASRPLRSSKLKSFWDGPLGCLSPISH